MLQTIADMRLNWLKYQYIGEFLKAIFRFLETEGKGQKFSNCSCGVIFKKKGTKKFPLFSTLVSKIRSKNKNTLNTN